MTEPTAKWGQIQARLLDHVDKLMASGKIPRNLADRFQEDIINARSVDDLPPEIRDMAVRHDT